MKIDYSLTNRRNTEGIAELFFGEMKKIMKS